MALTITPATADDAPWLSNNDMHLTAARLKEKIHRGEILMARQADQPVGWLRFDYFWDEIPIMNMLSVLPEYQEIGIGAHLVHHWEEMMKHAGHDKLLTSTQSDEHAQVFYRKLGFKDCGSLLMPGEPMEIILLKEIE